MEAQSKKLHVLVGSDLNDGISTLQWALEKWFSASSPSSSTSDSMTVVILYANHKPTALKDFVYTPFGKLPASAVSDEILRGNWAYEQEKTYKILSQYRDLCGQVNTEILKIEFPAGERIQGVVVDLISQHRITELVMSLSLMRTSSWRSKTAISGSFYIHKHKPRSCKLHVVCGGKLWFLGEEESDEAFMEGGEGRREEATKLSGRQQNMPAEYSTKRPSQKSCPRGSPTLTDSAESITRQWERRAPEIHRYYEQLRISDATMAEPGPEKEIAASNAIIAEKTGDLRMKMKTARETVQLGREEVRAYVERQKKAEWAISLCNQRSKELQAHINDEMMLRKGLEKELETTKRGLDEVVGDVRERKSRMNLILEVQSELLTKQQLSSMAKSHAEARLEEATSARSEMIREIEELRRQRDILHRRIEFCRDKDALGKDPRFSNSTCTGLREFTTEDIRLATDNFSDHQLNLKPSGDPIKVYQGRINHTTVEIKLLDPVKGLLRKTFQDKVNLLGGLRHPNLVAMVGFCSEPKCLVFEHMQSGSLRNIMFTSRRSHGRSTPLLHWRHCIRIAAEVCSGLSFLHLSKPTPIVLGNLSPSNILLSRNLVAKIQCFEATCCHDKARKKLDVHALGVLMLQLLAGIGSENETTTLSEVLEAVAGGWPVDLAREFAGIGLRCLLKGQNQNHSQNPDGYLSISVVMEEINAVRKQAAKMAARERCMASGEEDASSNVPDIFVCPIYREVMRNPHVAADGFSYELEAMEEWIGKGQDRSPMTNLKLKHKNLTPNHILRSLIQEWQNKRSSLPSQ